MKINIRPIQKSDNSQICGIIRSVLEEYGGKKLGTAYYDHDTEYMFESYQGQNEVYYIIEVDGKVIGGGGVKHLSGTKQNIAEFQKFYILSQYRGMGLGKKLISLCIDFARVQGYNAIYLETFENMQAAQAIYKKYGFQYIDEPLGGTGHTSCPVWMLLNLKDEE